MGHEASLEKLSACLRGKVLRAGDPGYEDARNVYNGMIDRRPKVSAVIRSGNRFERKLRHGSGLPGDGIPGA